MSITLIKSKSSYNSMTLFLSGDVMTGRGIDQVLPYSLDPVLYEPYIKNARRYVELAERRSGAIPDHRRFDYVWGDALQVLNSIDPDLCIINLETAVTTSDDYWKKKAIHYRMHPGNIPLLTEANIDICVLGNNHILDWGFNGLEETLNSLKQNGILTTGAAMDANSAMAPAIINTKSGRILVFSYADTSAGIPYNWKATEERPGVNLLDSLGRDGIRQVIANVKSYRREDDIVVISIHWGGNWGYDVPQSQQTFAHRLIDAGMADIIYGHSSHHPKAIEVHRDRLILYGCGDLINDYEGISGHEEFRDEFSLLYFLKIDPTGKLTTLNIVPMERKQFRLTHPDKKDVEWMISRLRQECSKFGTSIETVDNNSLMLSW